MLIVLVYVEPTVPHFVQIIAFLTLTYLQCHSLYLHSFFKMRQTEKKCHFESTQNRYNYETTICNVEML